MDPDTRRRDPSWASSIPLIRSASRPPGFRNARHPLFLARPLLFTPPAQRLTLFPIVGEEDTLPPSLLPSRVRGLKHEAEDEGMKILGMENEPGVFPVNLEGWIIDKRLIFSGSELVSIR